MTSEPANPSNMPGRPWWSFGCVGEMTSTDIRNLGRFNFWALLWAVLYVGVLFALKSSFAADLPTARTALALAPLVAAVRALLAYRTFLVAADELLRKIHLEGIALGFAVGFVLTTGWPLVERLGAPPLESALVGTFMVIGWALGQGLGRRRYA